MLVLLAFANLVNLAKTKKELYKIRREVQQFVEEYDKSNDLYKCVKVLSCLNKCE